MLIESHDRFGDVARYEPESDRFVEFRRGEVVEEQLAGHYARLGGELAVFYRDGGVLWLRIGDQVRRVGDGGAVVRWENSEGRSRFGILDGGEEVAGVEYPSPVRGSGPVNDPTPFAETEDWDFGLFVQRVLADDARRLRIYTGQPS